MRRAQAGGLVIAFGPDHAEARDEAVLRLAGCTWGIAHPAGIGVPARGRGLVPLFAEQFCPARRGMLVEQPSLFLFDHLADLSTSPWRRNPRHSAGASAAGGDDR